MNGSRQTLVHHLPNVISSIRIGAAVLVWLGVPAMFEPEISRWCFRVLFAFAAVSDGVDGLLARKLRTRGGIGYYLDPIADKLFLNTLCLSMAFSENSPFPLRFPPWCAVGILLKDVSWATGGVITKMLTGKMDIPPSIFGKMTTFSIVLLLAAHLLTPELLNPAMAHKILWRGGLLCIALAALTLSGYAYEVFRTKPQTAGGRPFDGSY